MQQVPKNPQKRKAYRLARLKGLNKHDSAVEAGYKAGVTASTVACQLEKLPEVQNALRKAFIDVGIDEKRIAREIGKGIDKLKPGAAHLAYVESAAEKLGLQAKQEAQPASQVILNIFQAIQAAKEAGIAPKTIEGEKA